MAIQVEEVLVGDAIPTNLPALLAGARAAPPEDCGGVSGYERLKAWAEGQVDPPFDPDHFDVTEFEEWGRRLEELRELDA